MARVRSLKPGMQAVRVHPTEVDCYYQTIVDPSGERILHLTTFGSDDRQSAPKSSQTIQLGTEAAQTLVKILMETFNIKT